MIVNFNFLKSAHIFNNGLLRICSKRYSLDKDTMNDDFVHIDSFAINIKNSNPEELSNALYHEGLRWFSIFPSKVFFISFFLINYCSDIQSYLKILENEYSKEEIDNLWINMKDLVALSILSGERQISQAVTSNCKQRLFFNE